MNAGKYTITDFLEVKASGGASFSPDGKQVCYLNNNTGTSQVYVLNLQTAESVQLTEYEDVVSRAIFSPAENLILFEMSPGGNENSQLFLINPSTGKVNELTKNPEYRYNFGAWSRDGKYIAYRSNERNGTDFDIYVMDIDTKETRCVFADGGWAEANSFSPKNTYLVVTKYHANTNSDLYVCNLLTDEIECITSHDAEELHGVTRWLPDESAFFVNMDRDREFMGLAKYELTNGSFSYVLTPKWDVDGVAIDLAGKYLVLTINEDGYDVARMYDSHTLVEVPIKLPKNGLISGVKFSEDGKHLIYTFTDSTHTQDIWTYDVESHTAKQLTHSEQGVPPEVMVEPQLIHFTSFDGLSVPAFIYEPKNAKRGEALPAIIDIHGGPESQYRPMLMRLIQYFVYNGYFVIAPNVRGSSGYGKTYLALDNVEKRMDSVKDLVALHGYVQTIPEIDNKKIVLSGGSYGGFMVLAGLAFYPDLWAGGIDIVGIANFITFLENTAPYRRALRESEYGSLEKDKTFLESISPINSVDNIKAPLMVIHGANDPRVPLSEAEQIVEKLKEHGRKVELLVYQDEGHGLSKLKNRLDAYPKVVSFLETIFAN